jgi:hypothetical protein
VNPNSTFYRISDESSGNNNDLILFSESLKKSKRKLKDILENESYQFLSDINSESEIELLGIKGRFSEELDRSNDIKVYLFWTLKCQNQKDSPLLVNDSRQEQRVNTGDYPLESDLEDVKSNKSLDLENKRVIMTIIDYKQNDKSKVNSSSVITSLSPLDRIINFQIIEQELENGWMVVIGQKDRSDHIIEFMDDEKETNEIRNHVKGVYKCANIGVYLVKANGKEELLLWNSNENSELMNPNFLKK